MQKNNEFIEIDIEIKGKTDQAIYINDGIVLAWIPKSLIKEDELFEIGKKYTIEIPEWLAIEKELV